MNKIQICAIVSVPFCLSALAQSVNANLDHVVMAVQNLEAARLVYSGLGFNAFPGGRHPGGTENSGVAFSGGGYLEFVTPYDSSLPVGHRYAEYLKQGERAIEAGLEVPSAEQAARDLRAAGLKISDPESGTIAMPGEKTPPPRWWSIGFGDELPSRPVFLIQYVRDLARPKPARPMPSHPNSVSLLSGLLIAVDNLEKAASGYGNIGKLRAGDIELPGLGAVAKEIVLERGSILLLRSTDPSGPTARRLRERGEGILGVRLTLTDPDRAREKIGAKNVSKDRRSLLVSPENAAGIWLLFQ